MELLYRCAAVSIIAALAGLVIKEKNPEFSLLLSIATVCMILALALKLLEGVRDLLDTVYTIVGRQEQLTGPLIKCFSIGLLTKITSELCQESSNRACAAAVTFAGNACAFCVVLPLLISTLKMIGGLL